MSLLIVNKLTPIARWRFIYAKSLSLWGVNDFRRVLGLIVLIGAITQKIQL